LGGGEGEVAAEDFDSVVCEEAGGGGAIAPGCACWRTDLAYASYEGDAVGEVWVGWEDWWVWWGGLGWWHCGLGVVVVDGLIVEVRSIRGNVTVWSELSTEYRYSKD
jgi:hypothetical protein